MATQAFYYRVNRAATVYILIFLFFLVSGTFQAKAQVDTKKEQPLIVVLKLIETQYGIIFSYADSNLKDKTIVVPPTGLSLQELLTYLQENTLLSFEKLNDTTIVVRNISFGDITNTQFLEEVIINNFLTEGISLKNDGTINLSPKKFGILPGLIEPDVLQAIQALPGVQSVDERVSNLNIRGGTHDQNLILWDGIKMYQSGHFFGLISAFNPYLIENVIVSKNGTSSTYGDGVSSIIDMKSSNTIAKNFSGGTGFNLINADAFAKIPFDLNKELQVSARRSVTDLIATPTYDQYFKRIFQDTDLTSTNSISRNERFYFYDVSAKFLYDISSKDKLRVNGLNVYNNLNYEEQSTVNDRDEALNSKLLQRNLAIGIEYSRQWNDKLSTYAQVYLSNYNLDATNFDVINDQRLIQENEVFDTSIKLHINYNLGHNLNYLGGYQFNEVGISNLEDVNNPIFRRYIKEVLRTHAVFNEVKFRSNSKNTSARIGLRTNYIEKFSEFYIEPRLSFNHRFLNYFRLEILGELKSQTTSQIIDLQNDFLGVEKRRWILANNDDIPVIKSKQISAGIHFKKKKLVVSAEVYIKDVDNITARSQGFQNQYQFIDAIGGYHVKGVDFLINKQFNKFGTWLSYSYSDNNYTFNILNFGNAFPNNSDTRHTLTFANTYTHDKFKFALGINWRTGKPFTEPDKDTPMANNFINYNTPNSSNLTDYVRADLSASYTLKVGDNSNAVAGFSLWNILNRQNIINTYYVIDDTDMVNKIENFSLGITPNFSFRLSF